VRTIFNILGPLTNPAGADRILMGVFHEDLVGIQIRALERLGAAHALVVHGRDGMDEVTLSGPTLVGELRDGVVTEYELDPRALGFETGDLGAIRVTGPEHSRALVLEALDDRPGLARDIVALNAGAALYAADVAPGIADGVRLARAALADGSARARLDAFVAATRRLATT